VILQTVCLEGKGGGSVSSFAVTVIAYRITENMTGTDQDDTELDSRLLASFCCENNMVAYLYLANDGNCWQKVSPFG
jgi:hypothetical protein